MRILGVFLMVALAKGAGLSLMKQSIRKEQNRQAIERMFEQRKRGNEALQRAREAHAKRHGAAARQRAQQRADWSARQRGW